jgi:amino acid adenylation domain-containing protein
MEDEAARPFEPEELLCRSALIRIDDEHHIWFINQHHLITDAWSCQLLLAAMDQAYNQPSTKSACVAAIGQSTTDRIFDEARLEEARSHWRRVYRSVPQQDAIFGRLNPERSSASERLTVQLDANEVNQLQAVASREFPALSPNLSLFIAFSVLLTSLVSRISQRNRIGFEAPFANRATRQDQATPGLFIELFPLAVDMDGKTTFSELGRQIQAQLPAMMKYGLPGASVPTVSNGCDAVLNFIPFKLGTFAGEPVSADFIHPGAHDDAHVLRLQVWDLGGEGGLTVMFDLNDAIVDKRNRDTVIEYFRALMANLVERPEYPVAAVPLLGETDRIQVIDKFNKTGTAPLPTQPIIKTILEQANLTPSATALEFGACQRNYVDMESRVKSIAGELMRLGISRQDRVCLTATRSMDLIETILSVLRLGAIYVPIDPDYPASRRGAIYDAVQPALLITDVGSDHAAPKGTRQLSIDVLVSSAEQSKNADSKLPDWNQLKLDDLAYMLFTSGSTGQPKGVPVTQMGLAVYLHWAVSVYADEQLVTMPLMTSIAFDLTVTSMFLPLLSGGSVVVYKATTDSFDDSLFRVIEEDRVNTIKLTPSHLRLLQRLDLHRSNVRNLIVGGEQFTNELAEKIDRQFGEVRIFNEYGPTEAVVGCMIHQYDNATQNQNDMFRVTGSTAVPIGKPAQHTRIYILNEARQPVHPDVTGELYVQRAGAPVQYLDDPITSERAFFPDLLSASDTMYRTGDLARFNRPGELIYLGRIDQQLKVAGHRLETEEVENALLRVAEIDACSVLLDRPPEPSLSEVVHCSTCGIGSDTPGIKLDDIGECNLCRDFAKHNVRVETYFRGRDELKDTIAAAARSNTGNSDCMVLLSGGKDSTYALYQVVGMGFKVYAFTLDNGYVSPEARANVERVVDDLGIDHEFASPEHMAEIFRDSLNRFSNVCQGCFKTIYTLSLRRADELGIPALVTGLSRGQLFETRLNIGLFRGNRRDDEIDHAVLVARKAYHRRTDAVTQRLGNEDFTKDDIFERIKLIDFYRYWSASLTEMLDFLQNRAPWIRPSDTGRSSNCLINDVGIYVHRKERGFHNYALPYSWDVRLSQKDREQAVHELNDDIDSERVAEILEDIDYQPTLNQDQRAEQLVAFFSASAVINPEQLRARLEEIMPNWSIPHRFIQLDSIPLTINGKVDRIAMLAQIEAAPSSHPYRAPETDAEEVTAEIWSQILPVADVGADDNFFELGGTSIEARLCDQFAVNLPLELIFNRPILSEIAGELEAALVSEIGAMSDAEINAELDELGR